MHIIGQCITEVKPFQRVRNGRGLNSWGPDSIFSSFQRLVCFPKSAGWFRWKFPGLSSSAFGNSISVVLTGHILQKSHKEFHCRRYGSVNLPFNLLHFTFYLKSLRLLSCPCSCASTGSGKGRPHIPHKTVPGAFIVTGGIGHLF